VGGLGDGASGAGADGIAGLPGGGVLGGAGGGDGLVDVAGRSPSWRPPVAAVVHRARAGQARQVAAGKQTARRFEALAGDLDPQTAQVEDLAGLRAIAEAAERARRDEALLTERVALARAHGRSWNRIAAALGVSRQAARQRFGGKVGGSGPTPRT
jgi:hypothetical protein